MNFTISIRSAYKLDNSNLESQSSNIKNNVLNIKSQEMVNKHLRRKKFIISKKIKKLELSQLFHQIDREQIAHYPWKIFKKRNIH
jgi:hypothetical protein